jgi:hypothetical protein
MNNFEWITILVIFINLPLWEDAKTKLGLFKKMMIVESMMKIRWNNMLWIVIIVYTSQGLNNSSFTTISTFPPLEKETLSILALLLPLIKLYSVWKVTSLQDPTDFILSSLKENGILLKGILDNSKDRENILCLSLTCLGIVYFFLS